ncbi:MAG: PqqD family protein [Calditrichaeota bacterium]|nr:PqqD family protein [Calditrichota bacterium]
MQTYKQNNDIAFRIIGGEAVLLNPVCNEVHLLNETGTFMWELLTEPHSHDTLIAAVCDEFVVDQAQVVQDVKRFSKELTEKGLIEVSTSDDE